MENNQPQIQNKLLKQINTSFDMKRLLGTLISNWYWFVLCLSVTLTAGFLYLRYTTPIYSIYSSVLIDQEQKNNAAQNVLSKLDPDSRSNVNLFNEKVILESQDLLGKVVDSLDLNVRYWAVGRVKETEIYKESPIKLVFDEKGVINNSGKFKIRQVVEGQFEIEEGDGSNAVVERVLYDTWVTRSFGRFKIMYTNGDEVNIGYLSSTDIIVQAIPIEGETQNVYDKFTVYLNDGRNSLLNLEYTDNIPQRGIDFMNTLIHFYQKNELESINHAAEKTREFINERKASMIEELKSMDSLAVDIQLTNDIIDPKAQTTTLITEKNASEAIAEQLRLQKKAISLLKANLQSGAGSRQEVIAGNTVTDPVLSNLINQYNMLVAEHEEKSRNLGPNHPILLELKSELAAQRKRIVDAVYKIEDAINLQLANANQNIQEADSKIKTAPTIERNIKDVTRNYPVLQSIYLFLYQKGVENEISVYAATNKSKVVEFPYASGAPIKPVPKTIYMMTFLVGILIPGSIIVIREMMNNKVINENDIESLTNIPIVGTIGRVEDAADRENTIVVGPHIRTGVAEQFRLIRANLEFMTANTENRVFMITSSSSGEGKSFIAINLGVTMTLAKKRVVIMEFDLRKPKISQYLGLPNTGGISGYLAGMGGLESVIKASGIHENLYIANCGPIPPNPGELLVSGKMKELFTELKEMFDVIIIDTAPIGLVSDALVLSAYSNLNLFIVRQSYTVKDQVKMFEVLHQDGKIQNPAIIFNGVEFLKKYGYGYGGSGYGYGYSYGYGYGNEDEGSRKKRKPAPQKKSFLKRFFTK